MHGSTSYLQKTKLQYVNSLPIARIPSHFFVALSVFSIFGFISKSRGKRTLCLNVTAVWNLVTMRISGSNNCIVVPVLANRTVASVLLRSLLALSVIIVKEIIWLPSRIVLIDCDFKIPFVVRLLRNICLTRLSFPLSLERTPIYWPLLVILPFWTCYVFFLPLRLTK